MEVNNAYEHLIALKKGPKKVFHKPFRPGEVKRDPNAQFRDFTDDPSFKSHTDHFYDMKQKSERQAEWNQAVEE